jgi:hypothetical protein
MSVINLFHCLVLSWVLTCTFACILTNITRTVPVLSPPRDWVSRSTFTRGKSVETKRTLDSSHPWFYVYSVLTRACIFSHDVVQCWRTDQPPQFDFWFLSPRVFATNSIHITQTPVQSSLGLLRVRATCPSPHLNMRFQLRPSWNNIHDNFPTGTTSVTAGY